jgi:hypothetical protein
MIHLLCHAVLLAVYHSLLIRYFINNVTPLTDEKVQDLANLSTDDIIADYPSRRREGRAEWLGHVQRVYTCFLGPCLAQSTVAPKEGFLDDEANAALLTLETGGEYALTVPWTLLVRPAACFCLCCLCLACRDYHSTGNNFFKLRISPHGSVLVAYVKTVQD